MSEHSNNAQAIIDVSTRAAEPKALGPDGRFFSVSDGGGVRVIDLDKSRQEMAALDAPRRKSGLYAVHDAGSFARYLDKHGDTQSEVWADTVASSVVGVLNAHQVDGARFEDHRVTYKVLPTDAWRAWINLDGKLLSQTDFAEHIEDRSVDIVEPSSADMLEIAQTFQATVGVKFESSKLLSSGERQIEYREQVDAKAGKAGRLDVPSTFAIALCPFEGADAYKIKARLRFRIDGGELRIGYRMERPADVLREAFLGVVSQIEERIGVPALRGSR